MGGCGTLLIEYKYLVLLVLVLVVLSRGYLLIFNYFEVQPTSTTVRSRLPYSYRLVYPSTEYLTAVQAHVLLTTTSRYYLQKITNITVVHGTCLYYGTWDFPLTSIILFVVLVLVLYYL
jgi:hypothetical protein